MGRREGTRRVLAWILAAGMCMGNVPAHVFAEEKTGGTESYQKPSEIKEMEEDAPEAEDASLFKDMEEESGGSQELTGGDSVSGDSEPGDSEPENPEPEAPEPEETNPTENDPEDPLEETRAEGLQDPETELPTEETPEETEVLTEEIIAREEETEEESEEETELPEEEEPGEEESTEEEEDHKIEMEERVITAETGDWEFEISGLLPVDAQLAAVTIPEDVALGLWQRGQELAGAEEAAGQEETAEPEETGLLFAYDLAILSDGKKYQPSDSDGEVEVRVRGKNDGLAPFEDTERVDVLHICGDVTDAAKMDGLTTADAAAAIETLQATDIRDAAEDVLAGLEDGTVKAESFTATVENAQITLKTNRFSLWLGSVPMEPEPSEEPAEISREERIISTRAEGYEITVEGVLPVDAAVAAVAIPLDIAQGLLDTVVSKDAGEEENTSEAGEKAGGAEERTALFAFDVTIISDGKKYQPADFDEAVTVTIRNIEETPEEDAVDILHIKADVTGADALAEDTITAEKVSGTGEETVRETAEELLDALAREEIDAEFIPAEGDAGTTTFRTDSFSVIIGSARVQAAKAAAAGSVAEVGNLTQLRAALANSSVTRIILTANIDVPCATATAGTDGTTTSELIISRSLTLESAEGHQYMLKRTGGTGNLRSLLGIRGNGTGGGLNNVASNTVEVSLRNITIDGGAVWTDGSVTKVNPGNSGAKGRSMIDVYYGATLNLEDGALLQNGHTTYSLVSIGTDAGAYNYGGAVRVEWTETYGGGTINVKAGSVIQNCSATKEGQINSIGGALGSYNYSNLNVYGGIIRNCAASSGGAIGGWYRVGTPAASAGTTHMYGGTIQSCYAENGGAVMLGGNSTNYILGGTITNCTASSSGAALKLGGLESRPTPITYVPAKRTGLLTISDCSGGSSTSTNNTHEYSNISVATPANLIVLDSSTVTFKNAEDVYTTLTVQTNTALGEAFPGEPTKVGYTFTGWNTKADGTGAAFTKNTAISADITVYAQWTESIYEVILEPNGGTVNRADIHEYTYGGDMRLPTNVTKENCIFEGWYKDAALTNGPVTEIDPSIFGRVTYYAKWTEITEEDKDKTFPVTLDADGGLIASGKNVNSYTTGTATPLPTAADVTRSGYTFGGWYDNAACAGEAVTEIPADATGAKTYYARWRGAPYKVTLNTNGGTVNSGAVTTYYAGEGATLPTNVTREGYTFDGWYANSALTGSAVTEIPATDTGDKTYYAKWTANTYGMTLDANGGMVNDGDISDYTYGEGAPLPTDVTRPGYTFDGWYDNADCTGEAVTEITDTDYGDKTYYAKWTPNTYDVTLNTNGGTVNNGDVTGHTYGEDTPLPTDVTRPGYTFGGWYDNADCIGEAVTEIPATDTGDKTFYAKWTVSDYDVTLNTNGGTVNDGNISDYTYGTGAPLPTDVTRPGCTFDGWYEDRDFSGDPVTEITEGDSGDKTYYAKWTVKPVDANDVETTDTTITVPVEKDLEYIVVPKGGTPTEDDWKEKGKTPGDGDSRLTFTNLDPDTEYEILVRIPKETDDETEDTIPVSAPTRSDPVKTLPSTEDPGNNSGNDPGNDPGNNPGSDPGNNPGNDPGNDPENNPESSSTVNVTEDEGADPDSTETSLTENGSPETEDGSPATGDETGEKIRIYVLRMAGSLMVLAWFILSRRKRRIS